MANTYEEFKELEVSKKVGLCELNASQRLVGWSLFSGAVYSFSVDTKTRIFSVEQEGVGLSVGVSREMLSAGEYVFNQDEGLLYVRSTDDSNPSSLFTVITETLYFSDSGGVIAPADTTDDDGEKVHWRDGMQRLQLFGQKLDQQNQLGIALEGSGKVSFYNDQDFWKSRYDKLSFENQLSTLYSWSPGLPISEAKILFRGRVQEKSYSDKKIEFTLKDAVNELRQPISLSNLEDLSNTRIPTSLNNAKQRRVYGYVFNMCPVNIDQQLDGYPIEGTFSAIADDLITVTGLSTEFLRQISPDDEVRFGVVGDFVSVESVTDDLTLVLSEPFSEAIDVGDVLFVRPDQNKRYINRKWFVAGHRLTRPSTTVTKSFNQRQFAVADTTDFLPNDEIAIGASDTATLRSISPNSNIFRLETNLLTPPTPGVTVSRPPINNVRIGRTKLNLGRDYTFDNTNGVITLDELAEFNIAPIRTVTGSSVTFTSASRDVTGSATSFTTQLKPGDWIRSRGEADFFEILSVEDDTNLTLRTASTYTDTAAGQFKAPKYLGESDQIICDAIGRSKDDTEDGALIKTAADVTFDILKDIGLEDRVNQASFTTANGIAPQRLGLLIPFNFSTSSVNKSRDIINKVNKSVFGALIQNDDFELEFTILNPKRPFDTTRRVRKEDVISFGITSSSKNIIQKAVVFYKPQECSEDTRSEFIPSVSATNKIGQFLTKTTKNFEIETVLAEQPDAQIFAARWAFLLSLSISQVKIRTKLSLSDLEINDIVDLNHPKLYERLGTASSRKIAAVESISKSSNFTEVVLSDLSNAFSRVATITPDTKATGADTENFTGATDEEKLYNGYITDSFGLINNDPDTFGLNVIW